MLHPLEDSPATVRVIVYPPHDHGSFIVTADVDKSVPISIISSRIPYRLNQKYEPCEQDPVSDMEGRIYTFIGRIDLDWHKEKVAVGYSETFYVIDSEVPMVLFGKSAFPTTPGRKSNGSCMPIMARKAKPDELAKQKLRESAADEQAIKEIQRQEEDDRRRRTSQLSGKCPTCGQDVLV